MASLAQLNLTEAAFVPAELEGFALILFWISDDDDFLDSPSGGRNGDGWAVRGYRSFDELRVIEGRVMNGIRPRQLDWEVVEDYPDWEDVAGGAVNVDRLQSLLEGRIWYDVIGSATHGTKLGGWPSLIQGEIVWAPNNQHPATPVYCFQIDSEERVGLNLVDSGVIHVGVEIVDGAPVWAAELQAY
jgi:hypothetical protein